MRTSRWRWPLRVLALGYLALLVVIPVGSIFYRAFEHGFGRGVGRGDHARRPPRPVADPAGGADRRPARHRLRGRGGPDPRPPPVPRRLAARRLRRHPAGHLAGHRRPVPHPRLRPGRLVRQLAGRPGHPGHLLACPASSWRRPRSPSPTWSARCSRSSRRSAPSRSRPPPPSGPSPFADLPADHPALDPEQPRLRRDPDHGPGARRVRRGDRSSRGPSPARPRR